jgi:GDPmannose 4,6-dehydratase
MKKKKTAIITGITGQDGSYLCELLLFLGYEVHGIIRKSSSFNTGRINNLYNNENILDKSLFLHYGDLTDSISILDLIITLKPDEFYNLAAQSHVKVSFELPEYTSIVNGVAVLKILELLRRHSPNTKFYQASTSEMYGNSSTLQDTSTPFDPQSPYATSKLYAHYMTNNYFQTYDLFSVAGILFNHESFRRSPTFVTKKIISGIGEILRDHRKSIKLGNLKSIRDWGWAPEYVVAIWNLLQIQAPVNIIVATNKPASIEDFLKFAFEAVNLNYENYVVQDSSLFRPSEVNHLNGVNSTMKSHLGWVPQENWKTICSKMLESELSGYEQVIDWSELIARSPSIK